MGADRLYYKGQTKAPSITLLNTHVLTVTASGTVPMALRLVASPRCSPSPCPILHGGAPTSGSGGQLRGQHHEPPSCTQALGKIVHYRYLFLGQDTAGCCKEVLFREQPPHNKGNDLETCPSHTGQGLHLLPPPFCYRATQPGVSNSSMTYHFFVLGQDKVIITEGHTENNCCHTFKAMDPLLPL